jgi:hypothetical protein
MQLRMGELLQVCCEPIDPASGTSGHAEKDLRDVRRGRAAYGSVAAFIVPFAPAAHPSWW